MVATLPDISSVIQPARAAWRRLPPRMRVLYISTPQRTGGWLAEAFAVDSASKVVLEEAVGAAAGLSRLRDEIFDAVLVSHEPEGLNALELVEALRTGGGEEPMVVLGAESEQEMAVLCYEAGADGYVCCSAPARNLIWMVARAVQRHQLVRENHRLTVCEQTRLQRERDEAAWALEQQRALLHEASETSPPARLPDELAAHYRQLLRTYVIMGSGNLAEELKRLGDLLVTAGLNARQSIELHLSVLEELVQGLGTRSARHVMARADLLVLELLLHVAEGYRCRYQQRLHPPVQRVLPGFEQCAS
jgi:DNA-binding response OmpR family regulator